MAEGVLGDGMGWGGMGASCLLVSSEVLGWEIEIVVVWVRFIIIIIV